MNNNYNYDEKQIRNNLQQAALFILYFECLSDIVVSQPREFLCQFSVEDGKEKYTETKQYKELKDLDSHIKDASFLWAVNHEIVDISDYSLYDQLRKKRNEITHNLLDYACKDIPKEDLELFQRMTLLYQKIDRWWINEVELPTNPEEY